MNSEKSWEIFLNPQSLRAHLTSASIYIAGFEVLKEAIIQRIRDFLLVDDEDAGERFKIEYASHVLALDKSPVFASLYWLKKNGAIETRDIEVFGHVKACRNALSHKLLLIVSSQGLPDNFDICFRQMVELLRKIEVWWIRNIDMPSSFQAADKEVEDKDIIPGRILMIQMLCDIALGNEVESRKYYDGFQMRKGCSE